MDDYPLVAMIQFNTSGLDVEEDDVAILALKAESMKKGSDDMAATILVPVASDWSENSSFSVLGLSIMSIVDLMPSGEDLAFGQIGIDFGSDQVLAFDVSEHLKAVDGERLSFLLMAVGGSRLQGQLPFEGDGGGSRHPGPVLSESERRLRLIGWAEGSKSGLEGVGGNRRRPPPPSRLDGPDPGGFGLPSSLLIDGAPLQRRLQRGLLFQI